MKHACALLALSLLCWASDAFAQGDVPIAPPCPESTSIAYQPSMVPIQILLIKLKRVDDAADGVPMDPGTYRSHVKLYLRITADGAADPSINMSSGNRSVDRALVDWARGIRFNPSTCATRVANLPVVL